MLDQANDTCNFSWMTVLFNVYVNVQSTYVHLTVPQYSITPQYGITNYVPVQAYKPMQQLNINHFLNVQSNVWVTLRNTRRLAIASGIAGAQHLQLRSLLLAVSDEENVIFINSQHASRSC